MPRHAWATTELRGAALRYAQRQGWPVTRGHFRDWYGCSCGERCEAAPALPADRPGPLGTHPLAADPAADATTDPDTIRRWWAESPYPVLLPTGRDFDVLDVPAFPGREALLRLELLGRELGPVARSGSGRILLWVRPGSALLSPLAAPGVYESLDIRYHSIGGYVPAPPSCGARWLSPPEPAGWELPPVAQLSGTVVCACRQARAALLPAALPLQRLGNPLEVRTA